MPTQVNGRVRLLAWASLASQTGIIGTGGGVRLTASGLGCPTWPRCTESSYIPTAEMGMHGIIEFGNRLLTFLLSAIAIAMFLSIWNMRHQRPDLFRLALIAGISVPTQAIIGGITVLTNLNPYVVGLHMLVSLAMVSVTTALVFRVYRGPARPGLSVPAWYHRVAWAAVAITVVTVVVGVLTTGSGPHAGDENAPRNNLDSALLQHIHSWPAYLAFGLVLLLVLVGPAVGARLRWSATTLAVMVIQIVIGVWQSRTGLPVLLVGIHMLLAAGVVSSITALLLDQRHPDDSPDPALPPARGPHVATTG